MYNLVSNDDDKNKIIVGFSFLYGMLTKYDKK